MSEIPLHFLSGNLSVEGALHLPEGEGPFPGVAICHPHPQYGGDMDNSVVMAVVEGLLQQGAAALRFNFRGVGKSQGVYSGGIGEREDAVAAFNTLRERKVVSPGRLGLAGYSFGAGVALALASRTPQVKAVAVSACPTPSLEEFARADFTGPKLFLTGDMDSFIQEDVARGRVARVPPPKTLHVLRGADHFLLGHEGDICKLVGEFFRDHL